ncbi:MAG: ATP-binding protein [Spirochaetes bacterium]|nr:ATP-binding protein [Spirochaetota bacterium]
MKTGRSGRSLDETRRRLLEFLQRNAVHDDISSQIELAVYEAIANIIEHGDRAYRKSSVQLHIEIAPPEIRISIRYRGNEFDITAIELPDLKRHFHSGRDGGLGIHIIRTLMDRVEYDFSGNSNELRMVKKYSPS